MSLGSEIKRRRKGIGWKQALLAERVDTSTNTISAIENDKQVPRGELLSKIAKALGVTQDVLTSGDPRFELAGAEQKTPPTLERFLENMDTLYMQGDLTLEKVIETALAMEAKLKKRDGK